MAGDSLDRRRDSALMVHRRGALSTRPRRRLRIKTLRRILRRWHLIWHEIHVLHVAWWLGRIRRRCALLGTSVHPIVHGWRLSIGRRMEVVHLHRIGSLSRGLSMCRLRGPLLARSFCLLLLLDPWGNGLIQGRVLQVHGRHERPGELLLCNKRVQLGLLRRPSLERVNGQQATYKVDESYPIVELCVC